MIRSSSSSAWIALAALALVAAAADAAAQADAFEIPLPRAADEGRSGPGASRNACPTWFPDFRCDRQGRWEGFHRPVVAPFLFEDPFITTGVYAYFLWHDFPERSVFRGGEAKAVAVQARLALTDRLAFIATKDGRMWLEPDLDLLDDQGGFLNLAAGLKYAFLQRPEDDFIASIALRIEVPTGSSDAFSGSGWGESILMPSLSAAWGVGEARVIGDFGSAIPVDGGENSTYLWYHLYAAYNLHAHVAPFIQLSGIRWVSGGDGKHRVRLKNGAKLTLNTVQAALGTGPFEGADLVNLGSRGVGGNDLVTLAIGAHIPIVKHVTFSVAYERPITDRKDIFKQRVTTALVLEF